MGLVATSIQAKLSQYLAPVHIEISNESYKHNVPKGSETHFKVVAVSEWFKDKKLGPRYRMVQEVLAEELKTGVRVSIVTRTPDQWTADQTIEKTPACRGGLGKRI